MSSTVNNVYQSVIEEVIENSKDHFQEAGVDESILMELKHSWHQKMSHTRAGPWDPDNNNFYQGFQTEEPNLQFGTASKLKMSYHHITPDFEGTTAAANLPTLALRSNDNLSGLGKPSQYLNSASASSPSVTAPLIYNSNNGSTASTPMNPPHFNNNPVDQKIFYEQELQNFAEQKLTENQGTPERIDQRPERQIAPRGNNTNTNNYNHIPHEAAFSSPTMPVPIAPVPTPVVTSQPPPTFDEPAAKRRKLVRESLDDDEINSDLDDTDDENGSAENEETQNIILCMYDKVTRTKNKWKCQLKDGVMSVNGKDYLFHKGNGDFEF